MSDPLGLRAELSALEEAGRLRHEPEPLQAERRADFSSNDVLGLSRHPALLEAAREALERTGTSGRASRLLGGGSQLAALEEACAEWMQTPAALVFPTGYAANLGLLGALGGRGDGLFCDRLNHASLIDAARLSRARVFVHDHLDLEQLEADLVRGRALRRRLVVTEGVFSMDGDSPPLAEIHELCLRHDAWLLVDEAHSIGLLGPAGRGAWAACGAADDSRLLARMLTGGKALGAGGALVACSRELRELLLNRARPQIYTTAPAPATSAALRRAIELVPGLDAERKSVRKLARALARALELPEPAGAVVPLVLGAEQAAQERAAEAWNQGYDVRAIRPPSVPAGTSRVRVVCHAFNTEAEVDELGHVLAAASAERTDRRAPGEATPMAPTLFVTGTDTDIGKTVVSALLMRAAQRLGPARYWKPVQTGEDSDTETVVGLAELAEVDRLRPAWELPLPASPHEAAKAAGTKIVVERVDGSLEALRRLLPESQLVVELAGGLFVPLTDEVLQIDWLEELRPPLVLVARSGLGTLNHTLLSVEALRARHLEPRALFLVGEPHPSNFETLAARTGIPVFELPLLPSLEPAALDGWLESHDLAPLFG